MEATLKIGAVIKRASQRLGWAESVVVQREERVAGLRRDVERLEKLRADSKLARERIAGIEREAGQASLKAQELSRRFGLTAEVPCAGTDLQGRCKLLSDAREAQSLKPSADAQIARLQEARAKVAHHLRDIEAQGRDLTAAPARLNVAEANLKRSRERLARLSLRAARQGELAQARETLAGIVQQIESLPPHDGEETAEEKAERGAIVATRQAIVAQREGEAKRQRDSLRRLDAALAALPAPFDASQIERVQRGVEEAQRALVTTEAAYVKAVRDQQAGEEFRRRKAVNEERLTALDTRMRRIEDQVGVWLLFAKCMSNDGLIALSIDDSGPTLSSLANDLLLACYGPRFTVSLKTLVETAKGETREGFDIVVHDAESGEAKSVTQMSAGERVWINEALTRAIALYLTQNSGRRYETLFSDEADGPLDPERKRMFMAMKREVLRIGGYRQEFFVSQTPELAAMADVVFIWKRCSAERATTRSQSVDLRLVARANGDWTKQARGLQHGNPRPPEKHEGWDPLVFPGVRLRFLQTSPLSAKDTVLVPATTKWSRTLTSTKASACLRFCVSNSSARLGSATPEGWLCANTTAAALRAKVYFTTSRG